MSSPIVHLSNGHGLDLIVDITSILPMFTTNGQAPAMATKVASTYEKPASKPAPAKVAKSASKPAKVSPPKAPAKSDKPAYAQIKALTFAGQHDEAIRVALAEGWPHVVESIERHRAKGIARKVEATALPAPKPSTKVPAPKPASAKKASTPITKKAAGKAVKASKAPVGNKPQAFPKAGSYMSESDLVLHWSQCKANGHVDIVQVAHQAVAKAFATAMVKGDKAEASIMMKRLKSLDALLSA